MSHATDLVDDLEENLDEGEKEEVEKRVRPRAMIVHETIRVEGEEELHRPAAALAWSALAAGLSMGFSLVVMGLLRASLPDTPWRSLLWKLGYPVGFLIVVIGRQQLFTENTLTPVIPLLHNRDKDTLVRVLRLWGVVFAANLLGAFAFALALGRTGLFPADIKEQFHAIAMHALEGGFAIHMLRAVFSGWLIALMVWLLPNSDSNRIFIIVLLTYMIGLGNFSHVIAGSVEVFYALVTGAAPLSDVVGHFLVPVLLGNMLGGVTLVGALHHAQVQADKAE